MMSKMILLIVSFAGIAVAQYPPHPIELKPILEVAGTDSGAQLGAYVKGVGDLNHDGYADVAVSAPGVYKTFIYFGGKTMSQTPSLTLEGGGHIVAGDFKGNGWIDLAIEKAWHDTVLVYLNGPAGLDTIPDLILTLTPPSDYFGYVMTAGDFFGNGYTDLAIGTLDGNKWPDLSLYLRGRIFIYAGGPNMGITPVDTIVGDTDYAGLCRNLAAGDITGDGKDDLVALGYNELGSTPQTQYYYISVFQADSAFRMTEARHIDARQVPGGFGGVSGNGSIACFDADGDGIADILVSGICIFKGGAVIDTFPTYRIPPPNNDTTDFGAYPWVGGGGDYNGDGIPDILLVSEPAGGLYTTAGVFIMTDGRGHPGQYAGYKVYSDCCGYPLEGVPDNAGDVNRDGVDDIIIGAGGQPVFKDDGFFGIYSGDTSMVAAVKERKSVPKDFNLEQNYPNPFNPTTTIDYSIPVRSQVTLTVYNILGERGETLVDAVQQAGTHSVNFNASRLASGVYFYRVKTGSYTGTKKMLYLK